MARLPSPLKRGVSRGLRLLPLALSTTQGIFAKRSWWPQNSAPSLRSGSGDSLWDLSGEGPDHTDTGRPNRKKEGTESPAHCPRGLTTCRQEPERYTTSPHRDGRPLEMVHPSLLQARACGRSPRSHAGLLQAAPPRCSSHHPAAPVTSCLPESLAPQLVGQVLILTLITMLFVLKACVCLLTSVPALISEGQAPRSRPADAGLLPPTARRQAHRR